jgi:hypothetical protein
LEKLTTQECQANLAQMGWAITEKKSEEMKVCNEANKLIIESLCFNNV